MKRYNTVYEIKTVCHVRKKIDLPFLVSELPSFIFFHTILMLAITR